MKKGQNIFEYALIFGATAIIVFLFATRINLNKLKTFSIFGQGNSQSTLLNVPSMRQ